MNHQKAEEEIECLRKENMILRKELELHLLKLKSRNVKKRVRFRRMMKGIYHKYFSTQYFIILFHRCSNSTISTTISHIILNSKSEFRIT